MKLSDLTLHQIIKEYGMTAGQPTPVSSQKTGATAKSNKAKSVTAPSSSPNTKSVSQSPVTGKGALPKATTSSNLVQATAGELPVDTVMKDAQGKEMGVVVSKVGNARQPDTVVVKNRMGKFQTMSPNQRVTVQAPVKEFTFDQFVNLPLMEQLSYVGQLPDDLWGEMGKFFSKHTVFRKRYQQALSALKKLMDRKTQEQQTLRHDLEYYAGLISRTYPGVDTRQLADLYRSTISEDGDLDENLRQWFEKEKWVRFGPDGKIRGDCARGDDSEGKPKCLPRKKAYRLGKKGRATAARRKRREDPNPERKGAAKNVATKKESAVEGYILKKANVRKYVNPGSSDDYMPDINVKDLDYQIINNKTGQVVGTASWTTNDYFGPGALKITMNNGAERYLDIWSSEKGNPQTAFNRFVKDPKTAKKYKDTVVEDTDIPFSVCPSCGGGIVHESQLNEKKKKKKQDACYHKVKAAYKVWPSAYASGALVQCRKMGAANWGKTTNEDVDMNDTLGTEVQKLSSLIKTSKAKSETYRSGKVVPNLVYVHTAESPQMVFELLTQKMGYKKRSGYDTNAETWDAHYSADSMTTKSDSVINQSLGIQAYYEQEHGGPLKVYFNQFKTVSNEAANCAHGKYYCNTDKKWKCRKGPKQSRSLKEGALPDNSKIKILNQLLSVPLMGNDVKSQMQAFFAIPSPQMINDFRDAIAGGTANKIDLRPIVRTYVNSLHPDVQKNIDLNESTLMEYSSLDLAKREIISAVKSIDVSPPDETLAKQNAQLLDKLYNVLNKNNVLDRIGNVLPDMLKGEYSQKEVTKIAQLLAEAPISFNDKDRFADNLKNDKVINSSIFITPGLYTVDQLTYGDPVNKKMLEYMKSYGVGQQMKGPLEHALAIFSKEVSIAGKGDITVAGEPVEVKAAIGDRKGSGGGRFGETGRLPSREKMLSIINSFPQLQPLVDAYLANQKSMNVTTFVDIVQQAGVDTATRADIGRKVFGAVFGIEAKPVIAAFSKPNADAEAVRKAYIVSNFNWYKNSDMGGEWKYLAAISLVDNAVAVISSGEDLQKISAYKKNPSIITTDKPQEMLFQFNPRTA